MADNIAPNWQRKKRFALIFACVAIILAAALAEIRFVPGIDDALSGNPQYLRYITQKLGEALSVKLGHQAPVFVAQDENFNCQNPAKGAPYDPANLYYVLRYSEVSYTFCLVVYARALPGPSQAGVIILDNALGSNYGLPLAAPLKVAPIGHQTTTYSPLLLRSLLHWRKQPSSAAANSVSSAAAALEVLHLPSNEEISINLLEVRPDVAARHDTINLILLNAIFLFSAFFLVQLFRLWLLKREIKRRTASYGHHLGWPEFLLSSLDSVIADAQGAYYRRQAESHGQERSQAIARRSRSELRAALESLLEEPLHEWQSRRIRRVLEEDDPAGMKTLLQELQSDLRHKSSEERLESLLEPIKEYCDEDQFKRRREQALERLHSAGFREARDFVTRSYQELKAAARKLEQTSTSGPTQP